MKKLNKLTIKENDNKTIESGFELDIKPYTVLIGENNSGKTNLINAFRSQKNKEYEIIYFSATNIELEKSDQASTSKKTSPFYQLLAEILKKEKLNLSKDIIKPINAKLIEITNKINKDIKFVKNKETILEVIDTLDEEAVIKNLIPLKILDKYWKEAKKVESGDIGQGTQRMVIFALLKYYSGQNEKNEKLNFFIIEEPEIYLHPKLKKEFNKILSDISMKENNQVLITTHDPYFVEMNTNDKDNKIIIAVQRNEKTGFTEKVDIKPTILSNSIMSHAEINYIVFDVPSTDYFLQLYQKAEENKVKGLKEHKIDGISMFDIRGSLAHKTELTGQNGIAQPNITEEIKKKSIEYLRKCVL
ncbi:MAG: AAA family ATPase [bacterium]